MHGLKTMERVNADTALEPLRKKGKRVVVDQDPDQPVERHVLAKAIQDIASSLQRLKAGGLNEQAIIVLVHHSMPADRTGKKVGMRDIKLVFDAVRDLERRYCR